MSDGGTDRAPSAAPTKLRVAGAPVVAIVLVTYYGALHLERLHSSLSALRYPRERRTLVIVENDPEGRAARWFAEHAPDARVIVPGENTGYAGGSALGMREALAGGADYVAIITQDTDVDPEWLGALVDVAERHPQAGAIQPKILRRLSGGGTVIHTWGNELHFLGVGYAGGDGAPDRPLAVRPIAYASGTGVLYRAGALRAVGGFDPALFMYHEDTDLSWRLRLAGWDVLLAPQAVMYHDYTFDRGPAKFYLLERNRLINLLTHYRFRTLVLLAPALLAFEACAFGYALLGGWFWKRLAVYGYFLRPSAWHHLREKRRRVQSVRRVPDRAVAAALTGRIDSALMGHPALTALVNLIFGAYWRLVRPLITW